VLNSGACRILSYVCLHFIKSLKCYSRYSDSCFINLHPSVSDSWGRDTSLLAESGWLLIMVVEHYCIGRQCLGLTWSRLIAAENRQCDVKELYQDHRTTVRVFCGSQSPSVYISFEHERFLSTATWT